MTEARTFYLAGPMTGLPDFNRAAFADAAEKLRADDLEILNPIEMDLIYGSWEEAIKRPWQEHLARDVDTVVNKADAVIVLPGWESSRGANLEVRLARTFNKPIYRYGTVLFGDEQRPVLYEMSDEDLDGTVRVGDRPAPPPEAESEFSRGNEPADARSATYYEGDNFVSYEDNPLRHTFTSGGIKDNRGKARVDLLPSKPLLTIAHVLGFGAQKYQPHNWRRGLPWGDTYASLQRHLLAWNDGEDTDPESKFSHLANAGCQLMFLLEYVITELGVETDSRFIVCLDDECTIEGRHPISDHYREEIAA